MENPCESPGPLRLREKVSAVHRFLHKKSLKRKQDPGSRPHKDRKNGQNPKKNVGKDGVARLPSRPGTTPQKKMDEFLSVGGSQEKVKENQTRILRTISKTHGKVKDWHVTQVVLIGL